MPQDVQQTGTPPDVLTGQPLVNHSKKKCNQTFLIAAYRFKWLSFRYCPKTVVSNGMFPDSHCTLT